MTAVFELDHEKLRGNPRLVPIVDELSKQHRIHSQESFNSYCRTACQLWNEQFGGAPIGATSAHFAELLGRVEQGGKDIIQTSWGGVVVTLHEHPRVEKFLVIRRGGYLALEMHEQKDERLEVKEGAGLILSRWAEGNPLAVEPLAPGDKFHFAPGIEHCLIGTENLLVFERSIDPKGMDQDLVFIYTPDGGGVPEEETFNVQ
ncbi:MAG TPA: hypothetical protein VK581_06125 [Chthoniobacterales bacterium]|nr:hypothetical protein [Chthoniobacterales bacterium]